jgi:outer membrane protein TolC
MSLFLSGSVLAQNPPSEPLVIRTLDQALAIALEKNPSIRLARENEIKTVQTVRQLAAVQRPSISASGTYSRLLNAGSGFGGAGGGAGLSALQNPFGVGLTSTPPGSQPVQLSAGALSVGSTTTATAQTGSAGTTRAATPSRQTNGDGGDDGNTGGNTFTNATTPLDQEAIRLSISQLIDITGVVRVALQLGDIQKAIQSLEVTRVAQETVLTVKNSFYQVLRAEALVRVNDAAVAQSEEQLRVTEAQKRAGVVAEFDVLRASTQLANNRQALISSRNQVAIARNAFANTLGIDPATPVQLTTPTAFPPLPPLDEAPLIESALVKRPEAAQANLNVAKSTKNTRLARRNLEPYLSASVGLNYNLRPQVFTAEKTTGAFGLTFNLPIYDGGAVRAAVESARADERSALIQQDQFQRGIKSEVQQAIVAVRDADERARTAEGSVAQAREAYRLAGVRFIAGVDTQLSVNDAQTALTQAETNLVNARYDYLSALARLTRALGNPE